MKCNICGSQNAYIRKAELATAKITGRAHVDCGPDGNPSHSQYRHIEPHEITTSFAFCESETGNGRWHVRKLDDAGIKLGGGITTACCCGMVKAHRGWDLGARVNVFNATGTHVNPECVEAAKLVGLEL